MMINKVINFPILIMIIITTPKKQFGNTHAGNRSEIMIAGKAIIYKDRIGGNFISKNEAQQMLSSNNKKNVLILKHIFIGMWFGGNLDEILLSFYTLNKETSLARKLKAVENIPSLNPDLGYLNPLWYVNYQNIQNFVDVDFNYSNFPKNFVHISNNNKLKLAEIFRNDIHHLWKHSSATNIDPISCEILANDLSLNEYNKEMASFKINDSKVLMASYLGVLNKFHSKIFLGKTRISIERYKETYDNVGNGKMGAEYVEDINSILK